MASISLTTIPYPLFTSTPLPPPPPPPLLTSTVLPILCLLDWQSSKCRLNAPPRFAPAFDAARHAARLATPSTTTEQPVKSTLPPRRKPLSTTTTSTTTSTTTTPSTSTTPAPSPEPPPASSAEYAEEEEEYVEDEDPGGFFTPVLSSATTHSSTSTSSSRHPSPGEYHPPPPTYRYTRPTTTTSTTTTTRRTTTTTTTTPSTPRTTQTRPPTTSSTTMKSTTTSLVVYLNELVGEGSGDGPDGMSLDQDGPAITPATTVMPRIRTTAGTVLPRPYESFEEAAKVNPEYVASELDDGSASIWQGAEVVPEERQYTEPMRTPAKSTTTELATTTTTTTTTERPTRRRTTTRSTTTARTSPKPRPTNAFTVPPVRPTTPMGDLITTMKPETQADFPRTALISIASVSVIMVIAVVVFCVFRCRQSPPPGDHYPMVCNGKSASGYTPIAPELSPPLGSMHHSGDPASQPLIALAPRPVNGYQPLKGTNGGMPLGGNGYQTNGNGIMKNGGGGPNGNGPGKKKDFKEWYV